MAMRHYHAHRDPDFFPAAVYRSLQRESRHSNWQIFQLQINKHKHKHKQPQAPAPAPGHKAKAKDQGSYTYTPTT